MSIAIPTVTLVSLFVEAILYGIFVLLFLLSSFFLLSGRRQVRPGVTKLVPVTSMVMFILGTIHLSIDLRRTMAAFLNNFDPTEYLEEVNNPLYLLKMTVYAIQTLVGDGFVLFRLYLVWNGDRRIFFPILFCFIASLGVAIGALQGFARVSSDENVFTSDLHLQSWVVAFFALTLFTNVTCTILIAARIWWVHRKSSQEPKYLPAMTVIIESGCIYSACLIILLVLYASGCFAQYIVLDAVIQLIGIVFSLIIVQVGRGLSTHPGPSGTKMLFAVVSDFRATESVYDISCPTSPQSHFSFSDKTLEVTSDDYSHSRETKERQLV